MVSPSGFTSMPVDMPLSLATQLVYLVVLALPIACVAWTVTHEEVFREFHDACAHRCATAQRLVPRKFFYLFTCEYCFSHYVTVACLVMTGYRLLFPGWRGYVIAGFSLVWVANIYMALFGRIRLELRKERVEITAEERTLRQPSEIDDAPLR
jgi:hypothetical protein